MFVWGNYLRVEGNQLAHIKIKNKKDILVLKVADKFNYIYDNNALINFGFLKIVFGDLWIVW